MRLLKIAVLFSFAVILTAFAQEDLIVEGSGESVNRDEALMAAKRDAIEKGIGTILLSQTEVENFMVKRDMIVTKTIGAVKKYDIISESKAADGLVKIRIKAQLSRSAMRNDLAAFHILIESMEKPRVMVIISENNIGNDEPSNQSAESAVLKFLKDPYEFDLVDPDIVAEIRSSKQKMAELAGDAKAAVALGLQHGAEVIITGNAVSRKAEEISKNLGGMISVQADITLRAVNCTTGRIIGSESAHAAKVHVSPNTAGNQAIDKAARTAAGKLLDAIIKDWQNQLNNGVPISVTINGVSAFKHKTAVINSLKTLAGVSTVRERNWNGEAAVLVIDVQYKGNTDGFCSKVDGFKLKESGGSLTVTGVSGQDVTLATKLN